MIRTRRPSIAALPLLALAVLGTGCERAQEDREAARIAQEALNVKEQDSTERTVESQRQVDVIKETTVVDRATGKVISAEKEVTPVTVTREKQVETDVDVNVGDQTVAPR